MKKSILPSRQDLVSLYDRLQLDLHSQDSVQSWTPLIPMWAAWTRVDARLGEIVVRYLSKTFQFISPLELRKQNLRSPEPANLAVLLEFVPVYLDQSRDEFEAWRACVLHSVRPAHFQTFFLAAGWPRPDSQRREFSYSRKEFSRWGFASEDPLVSDKVATLSSLTTPQRRAILEDLIGKQKVIRVSDYLNACHGRINRRTAERDIAAHPRLKPQGQTRSRVYRVKS